MPLNLRQKLNSPQGAYGTFLNAGSIVVADVLSAVGYDCLMIDGEHSPVGYETAMALTIACQGRGTAALMRIADRDPALMKRALDLGVDGVMVPMVSSAEEARAAVASFRYPPEGIRGMAAGVVRASGYGHRVADYLATGRHEPILILQVETPGAVEAIDEIVAVDGVDMLFIGPFDLSANLGHLGQPDHPVARAAVAKVEQAAKRAGRWLGTIETDGRPASALFADGYRLVLGSADLVLLREAASQRIAGARGG